MAGEHDRAPAGPVPFWAHQLAAMLPRRPRWPARGEGRWGGPGPTGPASGDGWSGGPGRSSARPPPPIPSPGGTPRTRPTRRLPARAEPRSELVRQVGLVGLVWTGWV